MPAADSEEATYGNFTAKVHTLILCPSEVIHCIELGGVIRRLCEDAGSKEILQQASTIITQQGYEQPWTLICMVSSVSCHA